MFLERRSYRRRRLVDAARLLPVFGLFLFLLPLLGTVRGEDASPLIAQMGLYIFVVWLVLVLCAALLASRLRPETPRQENRPPENT